MPTPSGRHLGGRRSLIDPRDLPFGTHPRARAMLAAPVYPARTDNRTKLNLPAPWDQGQAGTCEAHGCGRALLQFTDQVVVGFIPSRLDLYARARTLEGTPLTSDTGCYTRDMLKVLSEGAYDERNWPYDLAQLAVAPPDGERPFMIGAYEAITTEDQLIAYIAGGGLAPFAIDLPASYEDAPLGVVTDDGGSLGEHCQCIVDYYLDFRSSDVFKRSGVGPAKAEDRVAVVCGSWGDEIADAGYWYIPFSMILDSKRGGDCWALHPAGNM